MQPAAVVEHLDVLRDGEPCCCSDGKLLPVVHLVLQGREEGLRGGVVPADTGPPNTTTDVILGGERRELGRRVLLGFNRWLQHWLGGATLAARRGPRRASSRPGLSGACC